MGIATIIEQAVDTMLNTFVSTKSAALCGALTPIAVAGVSLYVMFMGYAIMRGDASDSFQVFFWKVVKISFVCTLALGGGAYQTHVVEFLTGIQGVFFDALGAGATIGGVVDNMGEPYDKLSTALWSEATTGMVPNLSLVFAAILVIVSQAILFVIGLGMYLLAKVAMALVLAIGPAFVLCAMWPVTQKYTEAWIGQVLNYGLLMVLIGTAISLLTSLASQFAQHVLDNLGSTAIMTDCAALLLCSGALAVVMLNVNQIASALAGGVSISGLGREIGRALMNRGGSSTPSGAGGRTGGVLEGTGSGSSAAASGGSGAAAPAPLYQRNVLDNLRRAA